MDNREICKVVQFLRSERSNVEQVWELIYKYVMPFRGEFFKDNRHDELAKNWREDRDVFSSAAPEASQDLISFIQGSVTPSTRRWFNFEFRDQALNDHQESMEWLETCTKITYESLKDSNFDTENSEVISDLVGPAISFLLHEVIEDGKGNLEETYFEALPVDECYFEQDHRGRAYRFYREFEWTAGQCLTKGGDRIPDDLRRALEAQDENSQKSNEKLKIILAVIPNKKNRKNINSGKKLAPSKRPFTVRYIIEDGLDDVNGTLTEEKPTLLESGHYEFPVYVPRYRKTSKSKFGHGCSHAALANILTANYYIELTFTAGEKALDPAVISTRRGLLSNLDLGPGGHTIVSAMDQIAPFESKARFDLSNLNIEKLENSIREAYFATQLRLKDSPAQSATEANIRFELMQRLMGPTSNRFVEDYLSPMLQRQFNINFRYGRFPAPPQKVVEMQAELDIKYVSPMAKAQSSEDVAGIERWIGNIAALSEMFPEARDIPDIKKIATRLRDLQGVDADLEKSANEIKLEQERKKKLEQRAQVAEVANMEAQASMSIDAAKQGPPPVA